MTQITQQLTEAYKDLEFDEAEHKYTVNGRVLPSVSGLCKKFKKTFESDKIAGFVAKKRGLTKEDILQEWKNIADVACENGTKVHLFGENYALDRSLKPTSMQEQAIVDFWKHLPDHYVVACLELQMYCLEMGYAGTGDIILLNTKTGKLVIADYKTNKDLFKNYKGQKMLPPFTHYLDNGLNGYKVQLSYYQILLENKGFEVEDRWIIWLRNTGKAEMFPCEDITKLLRQDYEDNRNDRQSAEYIL